MAVRIVRGSYSLEFIFGGSPSFVNPPTSV